MLFISTSIHRQPLVLSPSAARSKDLINGCHVSASEIVRVRLVAYQWSGCELDDNTQNRGAQGFHFYRSSEAPSHMINLPFLISTKNEPRASQ